MATFYGTIQGNRGSASRQGSRESGLSASAQSWNGSVIVELYETSKGETHVTLRVAPGSTSNGKVTLYDGPLADLLNGKVKCVSAEVRDAVVRQATERD